MNALDEILQRGELKNERAVALVRFAIFGIISFFDGLAILGLLRFTPLPPSSFTLALDLGFFAFASAVLVLTFKLPRLRWLKFITISIDYGYMTTVILLDPTVPRDGTTIYWVALTASIFLYLLNLLRYSRASTLYASVLSLLMFAGVSLFISGHVSAEAFPMLVSLSIILFIGYRLSSANREMMQQANTKQMMQRYFPPQLLSEFEGKNANLEPGGVDRRVTILFSDIRSFTSISESMEAREVVAFLNRYLETMTEVIFSNNGTIDKFMGDAIMTIFGAPIASNEDASRALHSALGMKAALARMNSAGVLGNRPLEIGIGIHSGRAVAGNIGSQLRMDYTVIGDPVNVASRIESMTKHYPCSILISEAVLEELEAEGNRNDFIIRTVDRVVLKGKSRSIDVYELMGAADDPDADTKTALCRSFETAYKRYRSGDFARAGELFEELDGDELALQYRKRCAGFAEKPPPSNWTGAVILKEK